MFKIPPTKGTPLLPRPLVSCDLLYSKWEAINKQSNSRGTQDQYIAHKVRGRGGGPLRLTEFFGCQIFNDVYMMNFTPKTPGGSILEQIDYL
jgi:hypothetical protein